MGEFLCKNAEKIKLCIDVLAVSLSPRIQFTCCLQSLNSNVSSAPSCYNTMIFLWDECFLRNIKSSFIPRPQGGKMDSLQTCALRLCIKNLKEICSSKRLFSLLWTKFTLMLLIPPSPAILLNMPWVQTVSQYYGSRSLGLFVSKSGTGFAYSQTAMIVTLLGSLSRSLLLLLGDAWLCSVLMQSFSFPLYCFL